VFLILHEKLSTFPGQVQLYGERHLSLMELCMTIFHHEYNDGCLSR
jgi:hypothetical protein